MKILRYAKSTFTLTKLQVVARYMQFGLYQLKFQWLEQCTMKKIILSILILSLSKMVSASDIDFYLLFESCKTAVGYLVQTQNPVKISEGDTFTMACGKVKNVKNMLYCASQIGQEAPKHIYYQIGFDSPPHLHFMTENGSEYIAINTANHAAVHINRFLGESFAGSKICHGTYLTQFEAEKMMNK